MNERSSLTSVNPVGGSQNDKTDHKSWLHIIGQALIGKIRSTTQVLEVIQEAKEQKILNNDEYSMIRGVIDVSEMQVREIMTPRSQMTVLRLADPVEDNLNEIVRSSHSRFPVIGNSKDDIEGILLAKDVLTFCLTNNKQNLSLKDIIRPPMIVPESKRVNVLLKEFRENKNHIAIIVDEYGGVSGLVTIEDVLEEIVGNIEDEFDVEEDALIIELDDNSFEVDALTPIDEFNAYFQVNFDHDEFETIGGLVLSAFAHLPSKGEQTTLEQLLFTVLEADHRRIHQLKIERIAITETDID